MPHCHFSVSASFISEHVVSSKEVFSEQFFDRADRILFRHRIYLRRRNGVDWTMKCQVDAAYYEFHTLPTIISAFQHFYGELFYSLNPLFLSNFLVIIAQYTVIRNRFTTLDGTPIPHMYVDQCVYDCEKVLTVQNDDTVYDVGCFETDVDLKFEKTDSKLFAFLHRSTSGASSHKGQRCLFSIKNPPRESDLYPTVYEF